MTPHRELRKAFLLSAVTAALVIIVLCAGCAATNTAPATAADNDTATFITAANACQPMNLAVTNGVGTFTYNSTQGCVLVRTLVSLNASESQDVKNMLEGKSMVCGYTKGNFDPRLVTSLTGGMEYCHGNLRDNLAELMVFSS
jgi:ABC-type transport system substrate-binding protein